MTARTPAQVAELLGFSRAQIYAMLDRREIGFVRRPGGHIRVLQQHIDEWITRNECPAQPKEPDLSSDQDVDVGTLRTAIAVSALTSKIGRPRKRLLTPISIGSPTATDR